MRYFIEAKELVHRNVSKQKTDIYTDRNCFLFLLSIVDSLCVSKYRFAQALEDGIPKL